ncbi:hypothetical protein FH972_025518 [Carpinus fangiana]|uniref:Uncharacterized protein n=1 Tax=Carpinus fangiana TaxID=176857 RepID=A0A5N6L1I1_9ROSI|nr:hypothetical protein FH972_025518 [Carpinus fangiana]
MALLNRQIMRRRREGESVDLPTGKGKDSKLKESARGMASVGRGKRLEGPEWETWRSSGVRERRSSAIGMRWRG